MAVDRREEIEAAPAQAGDALARAVISSVEIGTDWISAKFKSLIDPRRIKRSDLVTITTVIL